MNTPTGEAIVRPSLHEHVNGVLNALLEGLKPSCAHGTVNNAMITAKRDCHEIGHLRGIITGDDTLSCGTNS